MCSTTRNWTCRRNVSIAPLVCIDLCYSRLSYVEHKKAPLLWLTPYPRCDSLNLALPTPSIDTKQVARPRLVTRRCHHTSGNTASLGYLLPLAWKSATMSSLLRPGILHFQALCRAALWMCQLGAGSSLLPAAAYFNVKTTHPSISMLLSWLPLYFVQHELHRRSLINSNRKKKPKGTKKGNLLHTYCSQTPLCTYFRSTLHLLPLLHPSISWQYTCCTY